MDIHSILKLVKNHWFLLIKPWEIIIIVFVNNDAPGSGYWVDCVSYSLPIGNFMSFKFIWFFFWCQTPLIVFLKWAYPNFDIFRFRKHEKTLLLSKFVSKVLEFGAILSTFHLLTKDELLSQWRITLQ